MQVNLSLKHEAFICELVESGAYPSRECAIEAAIDLMRDRSDSLPVPAGHDSLLDEAEADVRAGRLVGWNPDDFIERLHNRTAVRRSNGK